MTWQGGRRSGRNGAALQLLLHHKGHGCYKEVVVVSNANEASAKRPIKSQNAEWKKSMSKTPPKCGMLGIMFTETSHRRTKQNNAKSVGRIERW